MSPRGREQATLLHLVLTLCRVIEGLPDQRLAALRESAIGTKRTCRDEAPMSAFGGKADLKRRPLLCRCWRNSGHCAAKIRLSRFMRTRAYRRLAVTRATAKGVLRQHDPEIVRRLGHTGAACTLKMRPITAPRMNPTGRA